MEHCAATTYMLGRGQSVVTMPDTVTLSLPIDTPLPVPVGYWWVVSDGVRNVHAAPTCDGRRIMATYTIEELAWALCVTDSWQVGLERLREMGDE